MLERSNTRQFSIKTELESDRTERSRLSEIKNRLGEPPSFVFKVNKKGKTGHTYKKR